MRPSLGPPTVAASPATQGAAATMNSPLKAMLLAFALFTSFAAPGVASAAAGGDQAAQVIELEPYLGVLWAFRGRLGGHEGLFLLDTGGGTTVLTPAAAKLAGCTPWGRITGFRMRGDRLDLTRCDDVLLQASG